MLDEKSIKDRTIKNQLLYIYLDAILSYQMFLGPILTIFYIEHFKISFAEFCLLDATVFLMVAIFEMPSGYLADRFGRKRMLLISQFFCFLSMVVMLAIPSYLGALLGVMIAGIFVPLGSGNAPAILYEYFEDIGEVDKYQETIGKSRTFTYIVTTVASAVVGILASISIEIPIILDCIILTLSFIVTLLFLTEGRKRPSQKLKDIKIGMFEGIKQNKSGILRVTPIFAISALMFCVIRVSFSFYQPIFTNSGIEIEYFGFIFAGFNIVCSIASFYANKIIKVIKNEIVIFILFVGLSLISLIGAANIQSYAVIGFLCIQQFLRGILIPYFGIKLNEYIPKETGNRVTYLSYSNFMTTLFVSLSLYAFGIMNNLISLKYSILIFGFTICVLLLVSIGIHYKIVYKGKDNDVVKFSNSI